VNDWLEIAGLPTRASPTAAEDEAEVAGHRAAQVVIERLQLMAPAAPVPGWSRA
jgi:hypothetical protein